MILTIRRRLDISPKSYHTRGILHPLICVNPTIKAIDLIVFHLINRVVIYTANPKPRYPERTLLYPKPSDPKQTVKNRVNVICVVQSSNGTRDFQCFQVFLFLKVIFLSLFFSEKAFSFMKVLPFSSKSSVSEPFLF